MSRSDVRCLFCDGRLPLYRKLTSGQFCSPAHKKAYWQEQERLAVERLHQTHSSLQSYAAAPETIEQILGQPAAPLAPILAEAPEFVEAPLLVEASTVPAAPEPAGLLLARPEPRSDASPSMVAADPVEYETALTPYRPVWAETPVLVTGDLVAAAISMRGVDHVIARSTEPCELRVAAIDPRVPAPLLVTMHAPPQTEEFERWFDQQIPPPASICAMRGIAPRDGAYALPPAALPPEMTTGDSPAMEVRLPLGTAHSIQTREFELATSVALPAWGSIAASFETSRDVQPIELRATQAVPRFSLGVPQREPQLRLAGGRRYAVRTPEGAFHGTAEDAMDFPAAPPEISVPRPRAFAAAASAGSERALTAKAEQLLPIVNGALLGPAPGTARPVSKFAALPQSITIDPLRPTTSRLQPLDEKPISDSLAPAPGHRFGMPDPFGIPDSIKIPGGKIVGHVTHFWKTAPRDLKILAVALPILVGLVLNPALPKVHVTAPSAGGIQNSVKKALDTQWTNVKRSLVDRSAVALNDDFRTGLDDWASRDDATATWSYDTAGFVRPATLALYRPSLTLTDYQFQFLGMIDKKAMSWIVRATDYDNYYVIKLAVLKPGPVPIIGLTRYAVVNGKADNRVDTPVPVDAREDTLYRVLVDVNGPNFSVAVQGQLIDAWSESRLPHGGVGFYSNRGEESRVRWVQVTHQYDTLGRLCAFLAPYDSTTNGR